MKQAVILMAAAILATAHPMGNFSVNHYARMEATPNGVELKYVLDLAELPTFDLLRSWTLESASPREQLEERAREEAVGWLENLHFTSNTRPVRPELEGVELVIADGAGNLPIMRITSRVHLDVRGGSLTYEDSNFPDRAGWKEIVIVGGSGATLSQASQTDRDLSRGLTEYPPDPTLAPPQDLRAELKWSVEDVITKVNPKPVVAPIPQPDRAPVGPPPAAMTPASAAPGTVVRGDFLSKMLHERDLTPWMIFLGIGVAFVLGAAHALTPGHGKTIVAAYLVGSRGTVRHALFLGAMVTFTHTISVFALGLATLFLFRYVMPDKIVQVLGAVSGLSIVAIGAWMLFKRLRAKPQHAHHHHHHHGPGGHTHTHTHMPDELSWAGLVALGASGGLVPCESALILLLGAVALGRVGLGLVLLVSFSLGLAVVLMAIGAIVLFAKNLLPERKRSNNHPLFRWVPVASAAVVVIVGFLMTGVSLGWIRTPVG